MTREERVVDDQAARWNGSSGNAWVDEQEVLDGMFAPFERLLVATVRQRGAARVLDVGCGTGSTTLAMASLTDECVGIDISEPMLALARDRASRAGSPARFVRGDAQTHALPADHFDLVVSRFGVMFFADPVAAFANLHRGVRVGGELRVIAWRAAQDNPFMTQAARAAAPLLPPQPPVDPTPPGQFAFGDPARVEAILRGSGWSDVALEPVDLECALPQAALARYLSRLGPLALALGELPEATRSRVLEQMLAAFTPYVHGDEVRYTAACWMVAARRTA
jgi:SAM-dependent methyltransferase